MSGKYQAYPEYKDSGVEWLGSVPEGWSTVRLDSITKYIRESKSPSWLSGKNVAHYSIPSIQEIGIGKVEDGGELDSNKLVVQEGDLLVSKLNPRKGTICVVQKHEEPIVASTEFVALRSNMGDSDYLEYLFRSKELSCFICSQVESATRSHQRVNPATIYKLKTPLPSPCERTAIAAFLDYETARIDRLIEKQQWLIELLKEKRQAVISHAVTKGLDPNVPMKDSGVEWLGQVPEHWSASKIRHVAKLESGHTPSRNKPEYWMNCTIPWISLSDVWQLRSGKQIYVHDTKEQVSELGLANSSARLLPKGTVILSRTASVGFPGIMGKDMATTQDFANWVCEKKLVPEYLYFVLLGMKHEFRRLMMGSTHKTIYMPDIHHLSTPLPKRDEQQAIVNYLEHKLPKFDELIAKAEQGVQLYVERRTALISAAVTGKIDVRNWQPNTSTQTTEPDLPMAAEQAGRYHV